LGFEVARDAGFEGARGFGAGFAGGAELGGALALAVVLEPLLAGCGDREDEDDEAAAGAEAVAAGLGDDVLGAGEAFGASAVGASGVGTAGAGTVVRAGCGAVAVPLCASLAGGALSVRESVGGSSGRGTEAGAAGAASTSAAAQRPITVLPRRSVDRRDDVPLDICPSLFADSRYAGRYDRSNLPMGRAAPCARGGRP
jgi:hypothetical protein